MNAPLYLTEHARMHTIAIEGMTCASCIRRFEWALGAVPGVTTANVNLATKRATVTCRADAAALRKSVEGVGYDARAVLGLRLHAALIPVAAGALYPAYGLLLSPALAAGGALSSVFVLGNALRFSAHGRKAGATSLPPQR